MILEIAPSSDKVWKPVTYLDFIADHNSLSVKFKRPKYTWKSILDGGETRPSVTCLRQDLYI